MRMQWVNENVHPAATERVEYPVPCSAHRFGLHLIIGKNQVDSWWIRYEPKLTEVVVAYDMAAFCEPKRNLRWYSMFWNKVKMTYWAAHELPEVDIHVRRIRHVDTVCLWLVSWISRIKLYGENKDLQQPTTVFLVLTLHATGLGQEEWQCVRESIIN